jgi:hypothetical protein
MMKAAKDRLGCDGADALNVPNKVMRCTVPWAGDFNPARPPAIMHSMLAVANPALTNSTTLDGAVA